MSKQNENKNKQPELMRQEEKEDESLFISSSIIASGLLAKLGSEHKEKIITDSIKMAKEIREKIRG